MAESDRVRAHTPPEVNHRIDRETLQRLREYAGRNEASAQHLQHLDREWDIERSLEVNAAAIGLAGLALGIAHDRRWLVLPALVLSFLGVHAVQGWCPPVPLFRRMGVRTRREIERERYALKAMRGDFEGAAGRSQAAWRAVRS
ncbi:MAG TPA: hypothetical protein VFC24_09730 [Casimicrobiaceae bacterium]|nr:hypothetical protein [Casimicrobiaceae bacterium]